jgi:hypothetical protein
MAVDDLRVRSNRVKTNRKQRQAKHYAEDESSDLHEDVNAGKYDGWDGLTFKR